MRKLVFVLIALLALFVFIRAYADVREEKLASSSVTALVKSL